MKMRKAGIGMMLIAAVGLTAGCAEEQADMRAQQVESRMDPCSVTVLVSDGKAPKWLTQKGAAFSGDKAVFYGVGNIAGTRNPAMRRRASEQAARADIAKTFNTYVATMQKQYLATTTAGAMDKASEEQHIEDVLKTLTEQSLVGVDVVEYWEHPCADRYEGYALARLDLVRFTDMVSQLQSSNSKFKELDSKLKQQIIDNSNKIHSEMSQELEKQRERERQ